MTAAIRAANLRALADFIEENPAIGDHLFVSVMHAFPPLEVWPDALRALGRFNKTASGDHLSAHRLFGEKWADGTIDLSVAIAKESTCERIQTGEETVEREVWPIDVVPAIVAETVPVYSWKCPDSWLAETA